MSKGQPLPLSEIADDPLVDWADLTFIDLAKAKTPEGRAEQVRLARDATHKQGFFYVINHGLDQAVVSSNCLRSVPSLTRYHSLTEWLILPPLRSRMLVKARSFAIRPESKRRESTWDTSFLSIGYDAHLTMPPDDNTSSAHSQWDQRQNRALQL